LEVRDQGLLQALLQDIVVCHPEVVPVRRMRTGMSNTWRPRLNNLHEADFRTTIWETSPKCELPDL